MTGHPITLPDGSQVLPTKSKIQVLEQRAQVAYDKDDRRWFYDQPLANLTALWGVACAAGAAWDDEVFDALAERGWFDEEV